MKNNQETEALLSPLLRDIRLKKVASYVENGNTVLDLASGYGYLRKYLPSDCKYHGVDYFNGNESSYFDSFLPLDLTKEQSFELIYQNFENKIDIITVVAFLEHIENHDLFFEKYSSILSKGGKIIGTTPHPNGRSIHDLLSKIGFCSRTGAEEHKEFLNRNKLEYSIQKSNGMLIDFNYFLFGLNQVFVIQY